MTDKGPRDDRWYLNLMAPNTKGDKFAWLDPTSIYINGEAFHDLLDDLVADVSARPEIYTPWLRIYLQDHKDSIFGSLVNL